MKTDKLHLQWLSGRDDPDTEGSGTSVAASAHADASGWLMLMPDSAIASAKGGSGGDGGSGGGGTDSGDKLYQAGAADGTAGYDIAIQFSGSGWTAAMRDGFVQAANYLTTVITADIGGGAIIGGKFVDDLYITASLRGIDGEGGVLAQAGPSRIWTSNELAATGSMAFDLVDAGTFLAAGLWDDIVMHEMMHVLGFGSLWNYGANPLVADRTHYIGAAGVAAWQAETGSTDNFIPVEDGGGSGTVGAHWDEELLGNELMTGYIDDANYLSKFSVVSLADLGYTVGYIDYPNDNVQVA